MSKIIVIGSNHAGTAAINTILDHYKEQEVVVYDKNSNISFLGCGMALWIGKQIHSGDGLFYATPEGLAAKGAKIHMNSEVTAIDPAKKTVTVIVDGVEKQDTYDKLILATGSNPVVLPVPGHDLENIQLVKLYQNAKAVIEKLQAHPDIKDVVIMGAGYIGVELAEAFERLGKNVVMLDMAERIMPRNFDIKFTDMMMDNMKKHNIQIRLGEAVQKFEGKDGKVCAVVTDKGTYKADMVISAVGFKPNADLGGDLFERFANKAYLTNRKFETSQKDIYAIGDCTTEFDNSTGKESYIALATNAVRSGIIAAHNACGTAIESLGVQGASGICIYNLKMVTAGLTVAAAEKAGIEVNYSDYKATQKPAFMEVDNPEVTIRIVYRKKDRVVVGAQLASTYDMSAQINMFSLAIQEKVTVDRIALLDLFFMPHFNEPYNYVTMAALSAK